MENVQSEVISGYSAKLPRKAKEVCFYTKTKYQDLDSTVQILDDVSQESYSLTCPISQSRQSVPVRTNSCSHVQTFDLVSSIKALQTFELVNSYSRLILKSEVDLPQKCPICKVKDTLYVDGIVETFIKFNPNVNRIKFTERGDAVAHETSSTNFDETINLVSPFPNCKVDIASSSCNFFSSPHFSDCSPQGSTQEGPEVATIFGPNNRAGLSSPLIDIRKLCSPPENHKSNETNVLDDQSSLSKDPCKNTSSSGLDYPNTLAFLSRVPCRSPHYSQLYSEASAFQYPDIAESFTQEAFAAVSRRRFSTIDLDSPRPIC